MMIILRGTTAPNLNAILFFILLSCVETAVGWSKRTTVYPPPISIAPSQNWDGNDGPWSTFTLQIGTPPQDVRVLIGTAATQTWAVATAGCGAGDPTNCAQLRGGEYNYTASSSWIPNLANLTTQIYDLGLESNLGYTGNGQYGFDDITLGWQGSGGPGLKNQTVAGIATKEFFMGVFGLTPRPSNFTSFNEPIPSYLENLRNQSLIPSTSWGYTAGNQYRLNSVFGSLTLGGYDASRFEPNNLSIPFSAEDERDLTVQLDKIITTTGMSLLPSPIAAFLDSTVSYIYLPVSACTLFENAFGIIWDETSELYLVNSTQHTLLQAENTSIKFRLGSLTSTTQVDIELPYAAFDLEASYPLVDVENGTVRYFPLKRADNDTQYTLGRAFFQEAYVIADYDRKNFSVSQCIWNSAPQDIVTIIPPQINPIPSNGTSTSHTVPVGAIAGGAVGGGVLIISLLLLLFFWWRPRNKKRKAAELAETGRIRQQENIIVKPELESTAVAYSPDIYAFETDGKSVNPAVEIGTIPSVWHEMPAREEVAAEMTAWHVSGELEGESRYGRNVDAFGFPLNPGSEVGTGTFSSVSDRSAVETSPRSVQSEMVISPESPLYSRRERRLR